jgi:lysophospholipase L1-like esterase/chitodextrinase
VIFRYSIRCLISVSLLFGISATVTMAAGPQILSLSLDEASGNTAFDISGNGNHGSLLNGPTRTPGKWGGALTFDGINDVLVVNDSPTLDPGASGITVAAWVYRRADTQNWVSVVSRQQGDTYFEHFYLGFSAAGEYSWFVNTTNGYSALPAAGVAPLGQWVHVVGTYDGSFVRLYVNGVQRFATPHSGTIAPDTTGITVGASHNDAAHTPSEAFPGSVDELRIYQGALSAAEVTSLYQATGGTPLDPPPTVSMTNPAAGAVVKGTFTATATAFDVGGVAGVQFMVDGNNNGAEDTTAPYTTVINTSSYGEGQHTLSAVARDTAGNVTVSAPVNVFFDNIAVMPLGDSLTYGVIALDDPNNELGGYRRYLWEKLRTAGISDVNFVGSLQNGVPTMDRDHEGHGGFRVDQITSSVAAWLQGSPADVILLWIGTNDFILGATPAIALNRLSDLLDTIHTARPGARLVLATQPGVTPNNTFSVNPQDLVTYNLGMPALVNARAAAGWNIELLDLYTLAGLIKTSGSPDYASDGLHFSLTGYSKIANVWYSVLDPAVSSDTTPPTIPNPLSVTGTTLSTVSLAWNASVDAPAGVAVYRVYRNGVPLTTTAARTFQDTGLTANTTYSYGVTAIDFANNESLPAVVNATTGTLPPDVTPPGSPSGLSATAVSSTRIDLSWTGSTDPAPALVSDGFNRANGGLGATWTPMNGTFQIVSQHVEPSAADTYTTARLTTWTAGDAQWAEVAVTVTGPNSGGGPVVREGNGGDLYLVDYNGRADHKLYSVVAGVAMVLGGWTDPAVSGDVVRLEAIGTTINVLVNGVQKLSVSDTRLAGGIPGIYAFAAAGERVQLEAFAAASSSTTSSGVAGYRVYRNGTLVITTPTMTYADTGLQPTTGYSYTVTAVDRAGNESGPTGPAAATTLPLDGTPPGAPTGLSATAVSSTRIDLSWTGSTDPGPGVSVSDGFNRGNGGLGGTWTALSGTFRIRSQRAEPTGSSTYTTARLTTWTGGNAQWAEVAVTVTGPNSGGGPVVRAGDGGDLYLVDYNGRADHKLISVVGGFATVLGGWTTPPVSGDVVRLEAIGTTIRVLVNGVQKLSVSDNAVPSGIPGMYAYAAGSQRVQLDNFAATSSGSPVAGYRVYRNGTVVTTTPATTYANTGLQPATGYSYAVTAIDGTGNESTPAGPVTATTLNQ